MIYEEERTIDEMIDDIVRTGNEDESVREEKTEAAGDGQARWDIPGEGTERATCRRCGGAFLKPPKSKRTLCPACFSAQVSAGMKASHAVRRAKRDARKAEVAANGRQVKTRNEEPQKGAETMKNSEKTVAEAWKSLGEPETEANKAQERDKNDLILDIYNTVRSLARTVGLDHRSTVQALYEIDSILETAGRA